MHKQPEKDKETVFYFTLIDLLVQVIFLGMFVFAYVNNKQLKELEDNKKKMGEFHELNDQTTRLLASSGKSLPELIEHHEKLKQRGIGKVPCLGSREKLATVRVTDQLIEFTENTPHLASLLQELKYDFKDVKKLTKQDFRRKFQRLSSKNCVYFLETCEETYDSRMRDAVESGFQRMLCSKSKNKMVRASASEN